MLFGNLKISVWLNIGITGHHRPTLGQIFVAHKIIDKETGYCWYPPILYRPSCSSAEVTTVARPETEYVQDTLYDMEASGFYPTAQRFSTSEQIQCLKIVSDNDSVSRKQINPKQASLLVYANIEAIENTADQLSQIAQSILLSPPPQFTEFLQRWHFTDHQKLRLQQCLRRWEVVSFGNPPAILNV